MNPTISVDVPESSIEVSKQQDIEKDDREDNFISVKLKEGKKKEKVKPKKSNVPKFPMLI